MKKKLLGMILCMAMVISMLGGCGSKEKSEDASQNDSTQNDSSQSNAQDDGSKTEDTADQDSGKSVEITWLHHFQEEGIQKWVNNEVTTFTEANPNIKVNVEVVAADVYDQILKTKIASDDAPMIFDLAGRAYYKEYGDAGHLYDLSTLEGISSINESMLADGQIDGKQYGVPLDVNAYCVHYNKGIFDQLGLKVPTTLTELKNICDTLVAKGIQPFAAPMAEQWCLQIYFDVLNCSFNPDPNWFTDKMSLASTFSEDEQFKKAVETYISFKPYWGDDPMGTDWDTAQNMLANGEAAMLINGSWTIDGVTSKNPDCDVRIFAMPSSEDPSGATMELKPGSGICMYNTTDEAKKDAGIKFMNQLLSKESGEFYATNAFKMSTAKDVDFSFSDALMDVQAYPESQIWNSAGVTLFSSEYSKLFYETLTNFTMNDKMDVDALAKSLDSDFASISK